MLPFGIGNDADAKDRIDKRGGLCHILVHGVVLQFGHADGIGRARLGFMQAVQMVLHDGALGGNAGQDALAAAAKAAHQVVYGAADDDDLAARAQRVYPNLRTAGGGADKNEIVRHAIMIGNGKAGVDLRRDEGFQLFLRHGPVGAERWRYFRGGCRAYPSDRR